MIKILDICSGIGGFSLGLEATGGFDTVAFCEFDDFCCKVLNKHWPNVPIYKDLKEIGNDPARIIQEFDLICGGIPCQPFSLAGKQKGKEDDRHLWPYMYAIVKSKKPTWVIVENVGGFVNVALDDVCLDLETQGYATQSFIIPACSVEAPTEEIEYGSSENIPPNSRNLWSTPTRFDSNNITQPRKKSSGGQKPPLQQQVTMWPTPRSSKIMNMTMESALNRIENTGYHSNLEEKVALEEQKMWPTPNSSPATASQTVEATQRLRASRERKQGILIEAVVDRMLPTPTARDWKGARKPETLKKAGRNENNSLPDKIAAYQKGTLNPNWVEWLMGYPQGWTDISDSSENPTSQG
jgi:site-specific DNA-cytosine methylase